MTKEFDNEGFLKDLLDLINKYHIKGNEHAMAEMLAHFSFVYIKLMKYFVPSKADRRRVLDKFADDACKDE